MIGRGTTAFVMALCLAQPASALTGCRHYAIWKYPWRQHCRPMASPVLPRVDPLAEAARLPIPSIEQVEERRLREIGEERQREWLAGQKEARQ